MAQSALTPVEFHGATLSVILINGVPFVALKPICEAIGLTWQGQLERIKRHPVLGRTVRVTLTVAEDGKQREMLMLPLDKLDGWLFGVSVRRVRPELRERLTQYQAECFDALARHFGSAAPRPDIAAASVPVNMHALPAPGGIDVRALLLSGQSSTPVQLTPAQQALIDARAWALAGEAYELSRQHLVRRVAYRTTPAQRSDPTSSAVADIVAAATLGNALAHEWHAQIRQIEKIAQVLALTSSDALADLQKLVRQLDGASK